MEYSYDDVSPPYRSERLIRLRDILTRVKADHEYYMKLRKSIISGNGDDSDMEEIERIKTWLERDLMVYKRLNAISIEGVTCSDISSRPCHSFPEKKQIVHGDSHLISQSL